MSKKIKSVYVKRHDLVLNDLAANELEVKARKYRYTEYDENGNIIKETNYAPDETIEESVVRKYEESILTEELFYDEEENLIERKTYSYNEKGKPETETKYYMDGSVDTFSYIYNDDGLLMKKICKDDEGIVERVDYFHYAGKNLILHEAYDEDNELIKKLTFQYDENDNVIVNTVFDQETQENFKIVNKLNEKNLREELQKFDENDNLIEKASYRFDEKGEIIRVIEESPLVKNETTLQYDNKGNMVKQEEHNENNQLNHRIERNYDDEGNILESRVFIDFHGEGINRNYVMNYEYTFF